MKDSFNPRKAKPLFLANQHWGRGEGRVGGKVNPPMISHMDAHKTEIWHVSSFELTDYFS